MQIERKKPSVNGTGQMQRPDPEVEAKQTATTEIQPIV